MLPCFQLFLVVILKNSHVTYSKSELFIYDYSRFNKDAFLEDFNQVDVSYLENSDLDVNNKCSRILQDLNSLVSKHAPSRKRSRKEMKLKDKPWINNRILKMIRILDRILQTLKKRQTPDNLQLYKKFTNCVSNELKESKARYCHNYFLTNSQNMKKCGLVSSQSFLINLSLLLQSIRSKAILEMQHQIPLKCQIS